MFISISLVILILTAICSNVTATTSIYTLDTTRGTETLIIIKYDKDAWKEIVSESSTPNDWFDGNADKMNAKNKYVLRSIDDVEYNTYDIWFLLLIDFLPEDVKNLLLNNPIQFQFTEDEINKIYDDDYEAWEALYAKWEFTSDEFEDEPDKDDYTKPIFKDPKEYEDILNEFNDWALKLNITMQAFNTTVPTVTKDNFFWSLIMKGIIVANPIDDYLEELIDVLDISNVKITDNTISIEREGEKDYTVKIIYSSKGTQNSFIIKSNNKVIYEISRDFSNELALIITVVVLIISFTGIIFIAIHRHKRIRNI